MDGSDPDPSDPVRLQLLRLRFTPADTEKARRAKEDPLPPAPGDHGAARSTTSGGLGAAVTASMAALGNAEREREHRRLARYFLQEVDRLIAGSGRLPGQRVDFPGLAAPVAGARRHDSGSAGPVTEEYLADLVDEADSSAYDVVGFSLTISQLGASMAFARRLKRAYPSLRIVLGGSQCAGPMGSTIRRICPYVDAVVHVEGEQVLGELVRRFRDGRSLSGLAGVSRRTEDGEVVTAPAAEGEPPEALRRGALLLHGPHHAPRVPAQPPPRDRRARPRLDVLLRDRGEHAAQRAGDARRSRGPLGAAGHREPGRRPPVADAQGSQAVPERSAAQVVPGAGHLLRLEPAVRSSGGGTGVLHADGGAHSQTHAPPATVRGGRFQLHRFRPYFEQPEGHGVRWEGVHRMFAYAFPADKADRTGRVIRIDGKILAATFRASRMAERNPEPVEVLVGRVPEAPLDSRTAVMA
ncbi:hypothetical protein BN2537_16463 [Streptomyces venezuelae]|nr:hypothetical protein BN2537_16463 [Streptomyces venezuelae]